MSINKFKYGVLMVVTFLLGVISFVFASILYNPVNHASAVAENNVISSLGASIYANDNVYGVRFDFAVDKEYFDGEFTTEGYGVKVYAVPLWLAEEKDTDNNIDANDVIKADHVFEKIIAKEKWRQGGEPGYYSVFPAEKMYACAWINFPDIALDLDICAVTQIVNGSGGIVYTSDVITRSFMYVATAALLEDNLDAETKTYLQERTSAYFAGDNYSATISDTKIYNNSSSALQITVESTTLPENTFVFTSSDETVVSVDKNGCVNYVGSGNATITVGVDSKIIGNAANVGKNLFVQSYQYITTAEEFFAINDNLDGNYILGGDIDFTNKVVNSTDACRHIGRDANNCFTGTLDGQGHALTNVVMRGYDNGNTDTGICANLFNYIQDATIKNTYFDLKIATDIPENNVKQAGLVGTAYGSTIENCYSAIETNQTAYGTQTPVSPLVAYASHDKVLNIKKCVGVIKFADTILGNGTGYATMVGRIKEGTINITDSYGLVLSVDSSKAAKAYCDSSYNSEYLAPATDTSAQFKSTTKMLVAMADERTGISAKGFNEYWKVDGNGGISFGNRPLYGVITTTAEFFAINNELTGYYVLGKDIDFTGIVVNETKGCMKIGTNTTAFRGMFDGNGYAIKNVTLKGPVGNGVEASLFYLISGATIRNTYFDLKIDDTISKNTVKTAGLVGTANGGAVIENCYSVIETDQTAYSTQIPVSPLVAYASDTITIKNCVGVIKFSDTISGNGTGYATMVGRIGKSNTVTISDSYGLVLSASSKPAKTYCDSTYNTAYKAPATDTSQQFTSTNEMITTMAKDNVSAKGFNNYWKVENSKLFFGDEEVLS